MTDISRPYKSAPILRITFIVILTVSILFPISFAYINNEMNRAALTRELVVTPIRLSGVTIIVFGVIQLVNTTNVASIPKWIRYIIELFLVAFITYWWLIFSLQYIDAPLFRGSEYPTDTWNFRQYIGLYMIATAFIFIFQSGLNFYKLAQEKAAEAEKLEREFAQVRLQALKNQVNPHFLFNSLSVLSSLVHVNAETADKFVQQLSKAYRYILDRKDLEWVTLKSELDFLDAYYFLLLIRFDKKIKLVKEIALNENEYTLPPLTLQLLIENAVKHNKMSNNEPLIIKIFNENEFLIVVNNINKREQHETSTGIGLENIQKRYAYITAKKIEITSGEQEFSVRIPLLKNNTQ